MSDNNIIEKVSELDIIVTMIGNKPYYEIKYKNIGENCYHIGYSSYSLEQVLEYRNTYFEIVHEKMSKMTNADRIRCMRDEELLDFLVENEVMCPDKSYCDQITAWETWLQSTVNEAADT